MTVSTTQITKTSTRASSWRAPIHACMSSPRSLRVPHPQQGEHQGHEPGGSRVAMTASREHASAIRTEE
jgi:hypothetical protein